MTDDNHIKGRQSDRMCLLMEDNNIYEATLYTELSNLNLLQNL